MEKRSEVTTPTGTGGCDFRANARGITEADTHTPPPTTTTITTLTLCSASASCSSIISVLVDQIGREKKKDKEARSFSATDLAFLALSCFFLFSFRWQLCFIYPASHGGKYCCLQRGLFSTLTPLPFIFLFFLILSHSAADIPMLSSKHTYQ